MRKLLATLALSLGLVPLQGQERLHRIPSPIPGMKLMLRQLPASAPRTGAPVLILHGATFPSANAAAWAGKGTSWMGTVAAMGRDVWALDFLGYGGSDRYPEMAREALPGAPLGSLPGLVEQVEAAVAFICGRDGAVDLVAHSAGTLVAGRYAETHQNRVRRLVFFGAPGPQPPRASEAWPSYFLMSAEDQWRGWESQVKGAGRWTRSTADAWAETYLTSDPDGMTRRPPSVRVPSGLMAIFGELERTGHLPYKPENLPMPTLLILGEWDAVTPLPQSLEIFQRLPSPEKRLVLIGQAGHRMHLEASRAAFFSAVNAFLAEGS